VYAGVCAGFLVASALPALSRVFVYSDVQATVVAGGLIVLLGAVDDRWGIDALTKLAGQVLAAGVMVLIGLEVILLSLPGIGTVSLGPESVLLTVGVTLLTVNAINFVDGLDGLAAGVGAIAALAFFAFSYGVASGALTGGLAPDRITSPTLIAAVLAGACLGFLPHNFNPARIFMGDSGSMLIGLMLPGRREPHRPVRLQHAPDQHAVPGPAAAAAPAGRAGRALHRPWCWRSSAARGAGRSPFAPDKAHLHHRLLEIGHSHTRAVLIMYLWTALLAFGGVAVSLSGGPLPVLAVLGTLVAAALVASNVPRLRAASRKQD
jgi:UDP-GlcNAc:undecaprenyl-phosphate GlcNAc-1-phosphate transferase